MIRLLISVDTILFAAIYLGFGFVCGQAFATYFLLKRRK